jgi:hypothetical protein
MSEAELHFSFLTLLEGGNSVLFDYISLMFAFLVMSYFAAHRLPTFLASIVISLFSVISGLMIFQIFLYRNEARAIAIYMFEQKEMGNLDLAWYGTNPIWAPAINSFLTIVATVGGSFACLAFFFYQRRSANVDL